MKRKYKGELQDRKGGMLLQLRAKSKLFKELKKSNEFHVRKVNSLQRDVHKAKQQSAKGNMKIYESSSEEESTSKRSEHMNHTEPVEALFGLKNNEATFEKKEGSDSPAAPTESAVENTKKIKSNSTTEKTRCEESEETVAANNSEPSANIEKEET